MTTARAPALLEQIQARHVELRQQDGPSLDGIVYSTAQNAKKAKGLEFDQVWLADDFMRFFREGREPTAGEVEPADVNLLYVALTRAKAAVRLGESFAEWLRYWSVVPPEGSSQR